MTLMPEDYIEVITPESSWYGEIGIVERIINHGTLPIVVKFLVKPLRDFSGKPGIKLWRVNFSPLELRLIEDETQT